MGKTFKSELTNKRGDKITVTSPVVIFEQGGCTIIYSPTLELYGYGQTVEEAKESLETNLTEFVNYTLNKGTFTEELERLGWQVKRRQKMYVAPSFAEMLRKNAKLINILDNEQVTTEQKEFLLPVA